MCLKISINSTSFPIIIVKWFSLLSICRASLSEERPIHSLVSFTFVLNYLTSALHSSFFVYSSKKGVWVALRRGVLLSEEEMGQKNSFLLKKKKKKSVSHFRTRNLSEGIFRANLFYFLGYRERTSSGSGKVSLWNTLRTSPDEIRG